MISGILLALHGAAAVVLFFIRKKKAGIAEGLLAVGLFVVLFSVGWTIFTMLTRLFLTPEGFGRWLDRDGMTLLILTIAELVLAAFLWRGKRGETDQGKDSTSA